MRFIAREGLSLHRDNVVHHFPPPTECGDDSRRPIVPHDDIADPDIFHGPDGSVVHEDTSSLCKAFPLTRAERQNRAPACSQRRERRLHGLGLSELGLQGSLEDEGGPRFHGSERLSARQRIDGRVPEEPGHDNPGPTRVPQEVRVLFRTGVELGVRQGRDGQRSLDIADGLGIRHIGFVDNMASAARNDHHRW
jgi:hypothetical protein